MCGEFGEVAVIIGLVINFLAFVPPFVSFRDTLSYSKFEFQTHQIIPLFLKLHRVSFFSCFRPFLAMIIFFCDAGFLFSDAIQSLFSDAVMFHLQ